MKTVFIKIKYLSIFVFIKKSNIKIKNQYFPVLLTLFPGKLFFIITMLSHLPYKI